MTDRRLTPYEAVGDFHAAFGVVSRRVPTVEVPAAELRLRQDLLDEEVGELRDAVVARDVVAVADALADIVYIACGTAQALGIPFDEVFAEVHRANMSKLGADGRPVLRADGKVLKGPGYTRPDVAGILAAAGSGAGSRADSPAAPEPVLFAAADGTAQADGIARADGTAQADGIAQADSTAPTGGTPRR